MPTASELVAQLNALDGDELTAAVRLLQNDQGPVIMAARGKIATAAKREGARQVPDLEQKLADAEAKLEEVNSELTTLKEQQPDLAAKEREWREKLTTKEREWKTKLDEKDGALTKTRRDVLTEKFVERLVAQGVNPKYARRVAAAEFSDRFTFGQDGSPDVLKPGEATGYDAADVDEKIGLLAADVVKRIEPEFINTQVDSGGGRGANGGGGVGYDPVKVGQQMAEQQKAKRESNLAFR